MLTREKEDAIYNALMVGMSLDDAYIYANLTTSEMVEVQEDDEYQRKWHQLVKSFEFGLLAQLNEVAKKQSRIGKEVATTWMLEKMFPRYSGKPKDESPSVNIHFDSIDPSQLDTVKIHSGAANGD